MVLSALLLKSSNVTIENDHLNCQQIHHQSSLIIFSGLIVAFTFILLLTIVSINYGQIVRHVRRKFWKRKARGISYYLNFYKIIIDVCFNCLDLIAGCICYNSESDRPIIS